MSIIGGKGMFADFRAADVSVTHSNVSCDFTARCPHALRENSIQSGIVCRLHSFKFSVSSHSKAMQLTKCLIVALILTPRIYQAKIVVPTSTSDKSTTILVEGVVKMVTSCYTDQINAVGLAGNLPDTLSRKLSVQHFIPVILMDDASHMIDVMTGDFVRDQFRYKLEVFVVEASSYKQLVAIVQLFKTSIWWNHMASFFILDQSPGCVNVRTFLFVAWQLGLLNAKVMCYHQTYGDFIFSYNPFTSRAPVPWRTPSVFEGINKHPFTVFRQRYQGNEAICVNLDFVKTRDLAGYEIRVEGRTLGFKSLHKLDRKKWAYLIKVLAGRQLLLHIVYRALNATPKFSGVNTNDLTSHTEMNIRYVMCSAGVPSTYPYQQAGVVLISKFRGHKSQLEKILCVIDIDSRIGMGIVYLVTLIFLKFFVRQALGPALLNLVRITCNTGFTNLPDNTALRLYLTGLLFFVVTMQGIFQGDLASLITTKIPVRNINSFEDLVYFGYKLYSTNLTDDLIADADFKNRFMMVADGARCIEYVLHDSSAACIDIPEGYTLDLARQNDLHLSRKYVRQIPTGFLIKRSWYLEERMNTILGRIMEADIFETWETKCNPIKLEDFQFDKEVRNNKDFKNMESSELAFAFVILGIGLLFATVTFIIEVAIHRYQQHNNNTVIVL